MKKTLTITATVLAVLLAIHLAIHNVDVVGFLRQLHGQ